MGGMTIAGAAEGKIKEVWALRENQQIAAANPCSGRSCFYETVSRLVGASVRVLTKTRTIAFSTSRLASGSGSGGMIVMDPKT